MFDGTVRCIRDNGVPKTNVPWEIKHHSPTGMEWGYAGSGPADFALNILNQFLPVHDDILSTTLHDGKVSLIAENLYQQFKFDFVAGMPQEGGFIDKEVIIEWLVKHGVDPARIRTFEEQT